MAVVVAATKSTRTTRMPIKFAINLFISFAPSIPVSSTSSLILQPLKHLMSRCGPVNHPENQCGARVSLAQGHGSGSVLNREVLGLYPGDPRRLATHNDDRSLLACRWLRCTSGLPALTAQPALIR